MLKVGVALGRLNPAFHLEVALEAERLGFESVWLPEHLVFPTEMAGSPFAGAEHHPFRRRHQFLTPLPISDFWRDRRVGFVWGLTYTC